MCKVSTQAERDAADDKLVARIWRSWLVDVYPNLTPSEMKQKLGMLLLKCIVFDVMMFKPARDFDELRPQLPATLSKKSKALVHRWMDKWEKEVSVHCDEWAVPGCAPATPMSIRRYNA